MAWKGNGMVQQGQASAAAGRGMERQLTTYRTWTYLDHFHMLCKDGVFIWHGVLRRTF